MSAPTEPSTTNSGSATLSVALMNDYEVVVRGLADMLAPYGDRIRVAELNVNLTPTDPVDVTLYDTFAVPQIYGEDVETLVANPNCGHIVVYSWQSQPDALEAGLSKGLSGYLPKTLSADELVTALERVHAGEQVVMYADRSRDPDHSDDPNIDINGPGAAQRWPGREAGLSPREAEMLALITQGLSNAEISARCYLSANTVKSYIRSAYRKIDVDTRARAVSWGMTHGLQLEQLREWCHN
ncbi:LuxR C-terminal-related transcriptional regulator [Ornithinimicrobium sp. INDO-MA30-4]|uniref:response regulator transcription factor n=1 Tax=Ornithinimicrobium sp. INDO-MA30-4 TaxID=2908651 RepID=UPI001F42241C|nr:LuxR C-terminal-related transcriptional regulator [Ornithinimicrobium sp. INDO-MA30-4]UJH70143.1 response regulator transcription factor [Ornithinimicrobium sp. INDO-MA30-4]